MDIKIVLALAAGVVLGLIGAYVRLRAGLSLKEWYYFMEFYKSLRDGNYEYETDNGEENDDE